MPKLRLFIDMDGTLARFHDETTYLERMFEKGFFENLKPFENMVAAVNQMIERNIAEVYILSSIINSPWCETEKNKWLDKYLPSIDKVHRIFAIGAICRKTLYVPNALVYHDEETGKTRCDISKYNILIDDYNKNLSEWQAAGGTAIKAKNNINHKGLVGELWQGELTDITANAENIVSNIEGVITPLIFTKTVPNAERNCSEDYEDCDDEDDEMEY